MLFVMMLILASNLLANGLKFKGIEFGVTKEEVMKRINLKVVPQNNDTILVYDGKILDYDAYIVFMFYKDKFFEGKYIIKESNFINDAQYYGVFIKLTNALKEKYNDYNYKYNEYWLNNLYKNDAQYYSLAARLGYVMFTSSLKKDDYEITVSYSSNGLAVYYSDTITAGIKLEEDEQKQLNEL
jgi:hypothetical protein